MFSHIYFFGIYLLFLFFFFSSRRRHTRYWRDWIQTCALPISAEHGRDLPVEREGRLAYQHALPFAHRHHQRRLNQLVRAVARDDAFGSPAREGSELFMKRRWYEIGITRPRARAHAPERLALQSFGRVPRVLVLVYLHRRAFGRERVSL